MNNMFRIRFDREKFSPTEAAEMQALQSSLDRVFKECETIRELLFSIQTAKGQVNERANSSFVISQQSLRVMWVLLGGEDETMPIHDAGRA